MSRKHGVGANYARQFLISAGAICVRALDDVNQSGSVEHFMLPDGRFCLLVVVRGAWNVFVPLTARRDKTDVLHALTKWIDA